MAKLTEKPVVTVKDISEGMAENAVMFIRGVPVPDIYEAVNALHYLGEVMAASMEVDTDSEDEFIKKIKVERYEALCGCSASDKIKIRIRMDFVDADYDGIKDAEAQAGL